MEKPELWLWKRGTCLLEVYTVEDVRRIEKWKFAKPGPSVGVNFYMRQFFIPASKRQIVCKALGLKYEKNKNRVKSGEEAAKRYPVRRG